MDDDPGVGEAGGGGAEELVQLVLGDRQDVGHLPFEEAAERWPDAGGTAQGEDGVDPGAGAEVLVAVAGPQGGGVDDEGGVGEAVHLEQHGGGLPLRPLVRLPRGVEELERRQVEAEGDADSGVHAGGRLGGPGTRAGQVDGLPGGERGADGVRRGGRAGQGVGDRVEEGPDQCLRLGQAERPAAGRHGHGVPLVRHGGGDRPQVGDVVGVEGSGPPGVVVVGGESGQQASAGDQVQGVQGGGAPAGCRGVCGRVVAGGDQQGQGVGDGQEQGGHGPAPCPRSVAAHDGQLAAGGGGGDGPGGGLGGGCRGRARSRVERLGTGQGGALGGPEGDPAVAGQGGGQEDGGSAEQAVCHGAPHLPVRDGFRLDLRPYGWGLTTGRSGTSPGRPNRT
ncbi:hypothetical protein GCM10019017_60680 [Streptomyces showdoensis]